MKKKMNSSLKSLIVLLTICLVVAILMAAVNALTASKIDRANQQAEQDALRLVLPTATKFEKLERELPESVTALYRDKGGAGYAAILSAKGYDSSNPMKIAVGFDTDGKILAVEVISCTGETKGIGTKVEGEAFLATFIGKDQTLADVDTISGATVSSSAFLDAVRTAATFVAQEVAQ